MARMTSLPVDGAVLVGVVPVNQGVPGGRGPPVRVEAPPTGTSSPPEVPQDTEKE